MAGYSLRHAFSVPSQHATGMLTPLGGRHYSFRHAFIEPSQHATGMLTPQRGRQLKAHNIEESR